MTTLRRVTGRMYLDVTCKIKELKEKEGKKCDLLESSEVEPGEKSKSAKNIARIANAVQCHN